MDKRLLLIGAAALVAVGVAAVAAPYADPYHSTKSALKEFGWEGSWSYDCTRDVRYVRSIPLFGAPFTTATSSTGKTTVTTVTSARMVTGNKLKSVGVNQESGAEFEVFTRRDGPDNLTTERSVVTGVVTAKMQDVLKNSKGKSSLTMWTDLVIGSEIGKKFEYTVVLDGYIMDGKLDRLGKATQERCRS
jgi:hypothetical protein